MATRRRWFSPGLVFGILLAGLACAALALAPGMVDGFHALQWIRHFSARNAPAPRVLDARPAGRWAARAVDGLAPLPQAWEAARLGLELGRRMQAKDGAAARALLSQVREALERAEASRLRSLGLGSLREEVWQAENSLTMAPQ
ncbi:MAG TPA: hypothetical protein VIZ31_02845 [Vicinamibacteria bacterium]